MNTEVDIFKGVANLPTYTEEDRKAVDVGSSNAIPRISIQGSVFSLAVGADKTPLGSQISCIILKSSGTRDEEKKICYDSKRYYKTAYTGDKGIAPDCASINGVTPDSTIESPECAKCDICPMQIWGSKKSRTGGKAKACSDYRRLAICILHKDNSHDIYQLDVPTVSVANLRKYSRMLDELYDTPLDALTTIISIGVIGGIPQVTFKEFKALSKQQYEMVRKLRTDDLVTTITTREVAMMDTDDAVEPESTPEPTKKSETIVGPGAPEVKVDDSDDLKTQIDLALEGE